MSDSNSTIPEGFRQIPGFPRYAIDANGTVLSTCRPGRANEYPWSEAKPLSAVTAKDGYLAFNLCMDNGRVKQRTVHTLVLTTFVEPRPNGLECRHLDGNKLNNHVSNLAWGTGLQNRRDRILHGTSSEGEKNGCAKLTTCDVLEIRRRHKNGELLRLLADDFNVSITAVWAVATRRTWKHV